MDVILETFRSRPEFALFLALGLGYLAGRIRIGSFRLGPVTGCLLAGVLVGQFGITVSPHLQQAFFMLFLFSIGYRVGPQFFNSFNAGAIPQLVVTFVLVATGLATTILVGRLLDLDTGTAAALLAGGLTESSALGTAQDILGKLGLPAATLAGLKSNLATAFAVAYLVGTVGVILLHGQLTPRLLSRPLAESCREKEEELGVGRRQQGQTGRPDIGFRAFRIGSDDAGRTVEELESAWEEAGKIRIQRIRRGDTLIEAQAGERLIDADVIAISGPRTALVGMAGRLGAEVDDAALLDVPVEAVEVMLTERALIGRALGELRGDPDFRPIYLKSVSRAGAALPVYPGLVMARGDMFRIAGLRRDVRVAAARIGRIDPEGDMTDMVFVGLFIVLGALFGIPALEIGSVSIGLGLSVGVLLGGLVAGHVRAFRRGFGHIPAPALWLFDSVGLCAFIACVGMAAGPTFFAGLLQSGPVVAGGALVVLLASHLVALFVGSRVLGMNEGLLLGTLCGAGTSAAALGAVQQAAGSDVPLLGYGIGYALGAVLLATSGTLIVLLYLPL